MNFFKQHYKIILFVICLIGSLVAIYQSLHVYNKKVAQLDVELAKQKNITTTIKVDSDVTRSIDKIVFLAHDTENRYKVTAPPDTQTMFGKCLTVSATISLPKTKTVNPKDETLPLYNFPYRQYLAKDNVYVLMNMKHATSSVVCGELSRYEHVQLYFIELKEKLTNIFLSEYEQPYAGLVAGVLVAGKGLLDKDSLEMFKRTSLSHVVVLSGSNVSIILVCIKLLVDTLFFWKKDETWLKKIVILLAVWAFVLLTGGGAPIYRAAVSAFCGLILFQGKTSQVYALTIVVLLMSIQNPFQTLYDPSFHLTCCATFGLILFSKPIDKMIRLSWLRFIPNWLREICSVTLATQVFVFPFIMFMTSSFSSVFLLSNVLVLPLIPIIMLLGFVTMVGGLTHVSWIVSISTYINNLFLHTVFWIVGKLAVVPHGYIQVKKSVSAIVLATYALSFLVCVRLFKSRFNN